MTSNSFLTDGEYFNSLFYFVLLFVCFTSGDQGELPETPAGVVRDYSALFSQTTLLLLMLTLVKPICARSHCTLGLV